MIPLKSHTHIGYGFFALFSQFGNLNCKNRFLTIHGELSLTISGMTKVLGATATGINSWKYCVINTSYLRDKYSYVLTKIYNMNEDEKFTSAGIILLAGDHVLVVQGKDTEKWSFPKGHREGDEDVYTTATRELKEETGVELSNKDKYCTVYTYKYNYGEGEQLYKYLIYKTTRRITPIVGDPYEIKASKWVHMSSLANDNHYDKNRALRDYIRSQVKRKGTQVCGFGKTCRNGDTCLYQHPK